MKTHFIRELEPNQVVTSYFIVHSKEVRLKKTGDPYLNLILADRSGVLDAKMWDGVPEVMETFERDDFVKVKGLVQVFRNKPQMTVHKLRRLEDREVNFADYFPHTERNIDEMWTELRAAVAGMQDAHLRGLVEAFLNDEEIGRRFRQAPAAKSLHHARIGGLLEHVLSLAGLCRRSAEHYPFIDADLLLTGVILHDLGKVFELHYQRSFGYTTEGQLLGHMIIVLDLLQAKAASVPGFPPKLKMLVEHMILSHHGHYEFGSPKLPMFPEALLLHYLDDLDSKLESMRASLMSDQNIEGEWTSFNPSLERPLLKKEKFLAEARPAATSQDAEPSNGKQPAAAEQPAAGKREASAPAGVDLFDLSTCTAAAIPESETAGGGSGRSSSSANPPSTNPAGSGVATADSAGGRTEGEDRPKELAAAQPKKLKDAREAAGKRPQPQTAFGELLEAALKPDSGTT